jgi:16S rRNA (cytosine1402-N4)-methyltransferase
MSNQDQPSENIPAADTPPPTHKRRPRYSGKNPRKFHEKYKELNAERYASDVQKNSSVRKNAGGHAPADHGCGNS